MVIQRWQSLLLLFSVIFIFLAGFMPFATIETVCLCATQAPIILTVEILISVLLLIDIFMYHNLRLQMKVAKLCIALILILGITIAVYTYAGATAASIEPVGGIAMPALALLSTCIAVCRMKHDYNLLRSADRLI